MQSISSLIPFSIVVSVKIYIWYKGQPFSFFFTYFKSLLQSKKCLTIWIEINSPSSTEQTVINSCGQLDLRRVIIVLWSDWTIRTSKSSSYTYIPWTACFMPVAKYYIFSPYTMYLDWTANCAFKVWCWMDSRVYYSNDNLKRTLKKIQPFSPQVGIKILITVFWKFPPFLSGEFTFKTRYFSWGYQIAY